MNILWFPLNVVQLVIILFWTALSGLFALLLVFIIRDPRPVVLFISHYFWSPFIFLVSMVIIKVRGHENVDTSRQFIYISNHESQLDITAMVRAVSVPLFFVAKNELSTVPVLGQYMRAMGMLFVDRKNNERAMESMKKVIDLIHSGRNVITFPEGTRTRKGELQVFKRGSFIIAKEGNIAIMPVAIKGTRKALPSGSFFIRPSKVEVIIGKPIEAEEFSHLRAEEIASFCRERISEMLAKD